MAEKFLQDLLLKNLLFFTYFDKTEFKNGTFSRDSSKFWARKRVGTSSSYLVCTKNHKKGKIGFNNFFLNFWFFQKFLLISNLAQKHHFRTKFTMMNLD